MARNGKITKYQFTSPSGEVSVWDTSTQAKIALNEAKGGLIQTIYVDPVK